MAYAPWLSIRERGGNVVADFVGGSASADLDPFAVLEALVKRYAWPGVEETLPLSGGLLGYLAYDLTHYATHHFPMRSGYAKYIKRYHMQHHYKDPDTRFGVSSPVWDWVFHTQGVE